MIDAADRCKCSYYPRRRYFCGDKAPRVAFLAALPHERGRARRVSSARSVTRGNQRGGRRCALAHGTPRSVAPKDDDPSGVTTLREREGCKDTRSASQKAVCGAEGDILHR